ncbi:MAG: hypothetical protein IJ735_04835 [Clostridia bacterium]|nr:hypothetical protein [Clostridia bacterium]
MQEFFNTVKESLNGFLSDVTLDLKLAAIGAILVVIAFLIAWAISAGSKMKSLRKRILSAIKRLNEVERIDEGNVDLVYAELKNLPEGVTKGWGNFMAQRNDYPSNFISKAESLGENKYSGKNTAGKVFFAVVSAIVWALVAVTASFICQDADFAVQAFEDTLVASILCAVLIPVAVFVIFWFVLVAIYNAQRKRVELNFSSFLDLLDEKVLIAPIEEEPYRQDDLEDVAKQVDELTDGRMEDEGEETLTMPEPVEEEVVEEPVEEEPVEEAPVEEEAPAEEEPAPLTREEEERYLSILNVVVDEAIADPTTTKEDMEEIAVLIATAKEEGFREEEDQAILEECLYKLADVYFAA